MKNCPSCGARASSTRERRRTHPSLPEFVTVRWDCRACGWSSDDEESPGPTEPPADGGA